MPATLGENWLSTDEAAEELGIATRTLYRWIDREDLPAYKLGRVIRIRRTELEEWLAGRRIQPGDLAGLYGAAELDDEADDGEADDDDRPDAEH